MARKTKMSAYLLECDGYYKIGRSFNLKGRLKTLSTLAPPSLKVIIVAKTSNSKLVEKYLHKKFSIKRVSGEWFKLSKKDVNFINRLYSKINLKKLDMSKAFEVKDSD